MELKRKTLIITGASMGIGRALALKLAQAGVNLVLNARHLPHLKKVAAQCQASGVQARFVAGNAAAAKTVSELVRRAGEIGDFVGFAHVAGVLHPGPFLWELPPQYFREVLESHLIAAYQLVRLAVPELRLAAEGVAVFFSSGAASSNFPGLGAYSIAKAAVEHLARQLAEEAPEVTTIVFRPAITDTRMQKQAREARGGAAEPLRAQFQQWYDEGRLRPPETQAQQLVEILTSNFKKYHGRTIDGRG